MKKTDFPTTRWTLVNEAADEDELSGPRAMNELLALYLPALVAHLEVAWRMTPHEAGDYVQGFATDKVLQGRLVAKADRVRGTFRRFLCTSLEHYVASCLRKEKGKRRLPALRGMVPLDEYLACDDITQPVPDSSAFDLVWLRQTVQETLRRLEAECRTGGRENYWAMFDYRVVRPHWHGEKAPPYDVLVARLGFTSPVQASNAFLTAKRMFARTFRQVVQEYVMSASQVDDEVEAARALLKQIGMTGLRGDGGGGA